MSSTGRRANGESSIYQDDAGIWHGWVTLGLRPDGRPDRRHRRGKTRAELVRKVRELERAREVGAVVAVGTRWTVRGWVEHYVEVIRGDSLALNTGRSYRSHLAHWIGPQLGGIALTALRTEDVERMFATMRAAGLSATSCERARATLRAALAVAVRRDLVARNVASHAVVPQRDDVPDAARPLTAAEAQQVLVAAAGRPDAARWALALLGMRPGEVLGLDWSAVDLAAGSLRVRQQLIAVYPYRHGCSVEDTACRGRRALHCPARIGGRMLTRPKSTDSRRRLFLPPELVAMLVAHRAAWVESRLRASNAWAEQWGDLVFCRPTGEPLDASADRAAWWQLLEVAGVEGRRLYDARHTAGTLLLEEGGDLQQVKDQLGHSQISVSSRYYVHATDRLGQDSAARLGGALFGGEQPTVKPRRRVR